MFAKTIIDSDAFLDMPLSSQALYFHLAMRADDDGFINNPKKLQRMVGCGEDDLKLLMVKKFILVFESGVIVIKHWKIHNYIRSDRYKPTLYQEEKNQIVEKNSKAYTFKVEYFSRGIRALSNIRRHYFKSKLYRKSETRVESPQCGLRAISYIRRFNSLL